MKKILNTTVAVAIAFSALLSVCFVTSVYAAGTAVRTSSEPAIGGLMPEEYFDQQLLLHEWLMSEFPDGTLEAPIRVPLTGQDRRAIANDTRPLPRPQRVGIVKRVGRTVKVWRGGPVAKSPARLSEGVIRGTDDGGFVWAMALESENASALRVHLSNVSLPDSADVYFFSLDGQAHGPYRGSDDFWTNTLMGTQGIVLVRQFGPPAAGTRSMSISVSSVANMSEQFVVSAQATLCGYNHPCIENAEAYSRKPVTDLKAATAYIEWTQGAWVYSCSGGLIADSDQHSQIPYFLTAHHCIKSNAAARNLEFYWNYTTSNGSCDGPTGPMTSGAKVKATGVQGDFTLLELSDDPPTSTKFMGVNSTDIADADGQILHRVHHPKGAPQSYTTHEINSDFLACGGLPIGQFIYSVDTLGSTEGGSSGSLVTNSEGEVVGQLYGGCGTNFDECLSYDWRTVDGALSFYFDKVSGFLAPPSCDPSPEQCSDGVDNDCDTKVDCDDGDDCAGDDACTGSCGQKNAACEANSDCCSSTCKRNGRCR